MLVSVALPLPLFRTFTYEIDDAERDRATAGTRVMVPFRNRRQLGIIVGAAEASPTITPRRIDRLLDGGPVVSAPMLALCRWIAEYYVVPLGVALRSALPAALTSPTAPAPAQRTRRVASLARTMPSLIHRDRVFARSKQQRHLFELIESLGGRATVEHLLTLMSFTPSVMKGLVARGFVVVEDEVIARDPFGSRAAPSPANQI